jgi:hypothetical protein
MCLPVDQTNPIYQSIFIFTTLDEDDIDHNEVLIKNIRHHFMFLLMMYLIFSGSNMAHSLTLEFDPFFCYPDYKMAIVTFYFPQFQLFFFSLTITYFSFFFQIIIYVVSSSFI